MISTSNLGGFPMEKKALFIVDMVNGFVYDGPMSSPNVAAIVPYVVELTKQFRKRKYPVYAFADAHKPDSLEFAVYPEHCLAGSHESEVIPEILPLLHKANVIYKSTTNAWHEIYTRLVVDQMIEDEIQEIHVVGCCTDICVLQFVLNLQTYLHDKGAKIAVKVIHEAVATYDAPDHDAKTYQQMALNIMKNTGVEIL